MAAEGPKKAEAPLPAPAVAKDDLAEEKADVPAPGPPADDSKTLVVADSE